MEAKLAAIIALLAFSFYIGGLVYMVNHPIPVEPKKVYVEPHVKWIEFQNGFKKDDDGMLHETD